MQESEQREVRESEMNHDPSPSSFFDERAGPHLGENSSDKLLCSSHQSNRKNPSLTSSQHHHQHHHHHHHQHHQHHHHHHQHHHRTTMDLVFKGITFIEPSEQRQRLGSQLFKGLTCIGRRSSSVVSKAERPIRETHTGRDTYPNASAGRKILDNVSGFTKSGQVLGVLGPSGSGKTTLLNILSGRSKPDQGCVTLNSCTLNKQLRRKIAYVLQHDIFFPDLTLRQTLVYTAMLRLPDSMSKSQKMIHVQNVIDLLELQQCENTIIGDILHRGLSGGEKKRVNIACELLSNPSVMLLDEPTSGLDSSTALGIMKFLKDYAMKERKTIVASVHQPSSQIFYLFDKLLLLSNGQLAYFGDTGKVIPFFSRIGFEITPNYNPADFMMERIKGSEEDRLRIIQAAEELEKTPPITHRSPKHHHQNHISNQSNSLSHHNQSISNVNHRGEDINRDQFGNEEDHGDGKEDMIENQSQALWTSHTENSNESRSCQESGDDGNGGHGCLENMKDIELRVVIDPCSKKMHKIYSKIVNDDDSGRSSWTDTDRSSTSTFSSSSLNGSTEEMYFGRERYNSSRCSSTNKAWNSDRKWPTSFWTQCKVLIERNFYESRGRLLSKLNWIQTIGLGLVTGLLWLQIPRTENSINDIRGWMFFASSYWMLFALFGALVSIPPEKEVVNKERASGAYRLSAYYIAKLIGELPPTITLPTVFHMISYSMFSSYSLTTFLLQWLFLILNSIVSRTIGFVIGVTSNDLELSITISALYSVTTNLFGGFYSTVIPSWLTWVKYFSIVHYAFHNMQIIEIKYGPPIRCSLTASILPFCMKNNGSFVEKDDLIIPPSIILEHLDPSSQQPFPIWLNTLILLLFLFIFQIFGYLVLRFFRKPK